jgi:sugar lactone lactonase YvrE
MTLNVASATVVPRTQGRTIVSSAQTLLAASMRAVSSTSGSIWVIAAQYSTNVTPVHCQTVIPMITGSAVVDCASHGSARPAIRMNEANVDPAGRYLAGSMAFDQQPGAACLYRLDADLALETVLTNVTISNGLDWSPDNSRCYYIDSPLRRVDVFDCDIARGELANRRPFVDASGVPGLPDGLTVDADGSVWVAFFGGARACRYDPDGNLADTVELPVSQVTSCCFGGPDLDQLIISTSIMELTADELRDQPAAGQIFRAATAFRAAQVAFRGVTSNRSK